MTPRTKWTIAATLLLLLVVWWKQDMEMRRDPALFNQYKMTRLEGH
jgi:hypothetical protein